MTSKEALTPIDLGFLRQYSLVFALSNDTTDVFVPTQFIVEYNTQVLTCTNCVNHFPFYSSRFWVTSALPKIDTNLSFLKHSNTGNCHYTFWQNCLSPPCTQCQYRFGDSWVICKLNHCAWTIRMPAVSSVQCEKEWNKNCALWGPRVSPNYSRSSSL